MNFSSVLSLPDAEGKEVIGFRCQLADYRTPGLWHQERSSQYVHLTEGWLRMDRAIAYPMPSQAGAAFLLPGLMNGDGEIGKRLGAMEAG